MTSLTPGKHQWTRSIIKNNEISPTFWRMYHEFVFDEALRDPASTSSLERFDAFLTALSDGRYDYHTTSQMPHIWLSRELQGMGAGMARQKLTQSLMDNVRDIIISAYEIDGVTLLRHSIYLRSRNPRFKDVRLENVWTTAPRLFLTALEKARTR